MRIHRLVVVVVVLFWLSAFVAAAQSPVALPYTVTTVGALTPLKTASTQCPNLATGVKSANTYGDNCLAINAYFGGGNYDAPVLDSLGNLFVADDNNSMVHRVDLATGMMTVAMGGGAVCSGKVDSEGDGCLTATNTLLYKNHGMGIDPYGNLLISDQGKSLLRVACRTASPLCTTAQIGYSELLAGCVATTASAGTAATTSMIGLSNQPAIASGTCSATSGGLLGNVYGITADMYGNVFYAEAGTMRFRVILGPQTSSYFTGTNPLWTALGVYYPSLTAGYFYSVINTTDTASCDGLTTAACVGTATVKGNSYSNTVNSTTYSCTALDTYGDGCPFNNSSVATGSSGYVMSVSVDAAGNMAFVSGGSGLRVLFVSGAGTAGTAMVKAIEANNPTVTSPTPGYVYRLAGGGATGVSSTPGLGTSSTLSLSGSGRLVVTPQGNILVTDSATVYFFDVNSGFIRTLFASSSNVAAGSYCSGTAGQLSLSAYSDGCAASKTKFSAAGTTMDSQGNLYMWDSGGGASGMILRKILAQGLAEQTVGTTLLQTFLVHIPQSSSTGVSSGTVSGATATLTMNSDMSAATPSCTANADYSVDCTVVVTATPTAPGYRNANLTVTLPSTTTWTNSAMTINLFGNVSGSALATDGGATTLLGTTTAVAPTTASVFSNITPQAVAVDGAGNPYVIDAATGSVKEYVNGGTPTLATGLTATASSIAIDPAGNLFVVGRGTASINEWKLTSAGTPATYVSTTLSYTPTSGTTAPQAIASDNQGNLYVADYQSNTLSSIYKIQQPMTVNQASLMTQTTVATGLSNPVAIAVDASGNIYVADSGAQAVLKIAPILNTTTGLYTYNSSTFLSGVMPVGISVDAAGDVYVQDSTTDKILMVPASGPSSVQVLSGLSSPKGVAVDNKGNVFSADSTLSSITEVLRSNVSQGLGNANASTAVTYTATISNVGNLAAYGQGYASYNDANILVTSGTTNGCFFSTTNLYMLTGSSSTNPLIFPTGAACTLSASLTSTGASTVSDAINLDAASGAPTTQLASSVGQLMLTGTPSTGSSYTTTTMLGTVGGTLIFATSGATEATVPVTVTNVISSSAPTGGSITYYVDGATTETGSLSYSSLTANGAAVTGTISLSGLTAGTHTITAGYGGYGSYIASTTSAAMSFTIGSAATSVSWLPTTMTQQVSTPIGTTVLNATASPSINGYFIYSITALPSCMATTSSSTSTININSATYLPIGNYTLYASFCPTDSVDYASSSKTISGYTVTQASSTASVGATTNLLAADGTGNFTSLSVALGSLPSTGGSIYIKPGTYLGQNAVTYPNVYLRGLGGDPTKVILSASDGPFSAGGFGYIGTGDGSGNGNAAGDQGSSVLDIASGTYMGDSSGSTSTPTGVKHTGNTTPYNFYAEYLTVQNTWDYNTSLTTDIYYSGGSTCSYQSPDAYYTLQYLYNNGKLCGGQALAVWLATDKTIFNNVNLNSQQDTILAGSQGCGSSTCTVARNYYWKGMISGNVDYIWGDAALVLDQTTLFSTFHGSATGMITMTAQNKHFQTGSSGDYLSGTICNGCTMLTPATNMTAVYYGRPYGAYSTVILLDSNVDQVTPAAWAEFSGQTNLPTSTYGEYNTMAYKDPTVGSSGYPSTMNGATNTGGNIGAGATSYSLRETTSTAPGTLQAANAQSTILTAMQAVNYYPINFLGSTIASANLASGQVSTWNPLSDLATRVNAFAPTTALTSISYGTAVTILGRPQTPGAGMVPTGSYAFYDSLNSNKVCTAVGSGCTLLASGTLDAAGEAYLITGSASSNALSSGTHYVTMYYGGDANFAGSTSSTYSINISSNLVPTTSTLSVSTPNTTYGGTVSGSVAVTATTGALAPNGTVNLLSGSTVLGSCTLSAGTGLSSSCSFALTSVPAGNQAMTASYAVTGSTDGSKTFSASTSNSVNINVSRVVLQVTASNATMVVGGTLPSYTYTTSGYVNGDTSTVLSGAPAFTTTGTGASIGEYPIFITTGTLAASNYTFNFRGAYLYVTATSQAPAVATGDLRTVTEPVFPSVCQQLNADIAQVNNDIPTSVDTAATPLTNANLVNPTVTNPDGGRIQAALNACSASYPGTGAGLAVELSADASGNNAFLTGPLTIPSNVTLLVDPGVVLFFSRNARDYDIVQGTYQCGNISTASYVCQSMVTIPKTATNVGIMGYGKLDGRSSDPLINAISPYQGFSWLGLAAAYTSSNAAQVPPFVTITGGSSNVTLYKITIQNAANRHIGDGASNSTIWGVKLITPTSGRNTDGIDTGNSNITITRSWISDGDDNVALGASNTPADNISITHNHLYAGHGQSIGSYTGSGLANILWDNNMAAGNGFANVGSASITGTSDSNSIGIRIKAANDRGGLVTGIQYSNGCFLDHAGDIQFTTLYNTNAGNMTPNFKNILLQNLVFANDYPTSSAGNLEFTGANNTSVSPAVVYPLQVTLDNVTFPSAVSTSSFASGLETTADLTYGPGQVSSNFINAWAGFVNTAANNDVVINNITATSLNPPACSYTYIAPELTGPTGLPQTILQGQTGTAVVILTPAVGGAAYPTGTVTLTDALTGSAYSATLPGTTDTLFVPLTGLTAGTHTFTAAYYGDNNYVPSTTGAAYSTAGPYVITVTPSATSLSATTTTLNALPANISFGTSTTIVATVAGSNPTGTVQFIVNGTAYASLPLKSTTTSGTASATFTLPQSSAAYSIYAVYSGDSVNAGSSSAVATVTVGAAATTTALSAATTSTTLGHPVTVVATVSSTAGTPTGTVAFTYVTSTSSTVLNLLTATLTNGVASATFNLPVGTDYVSAAYTSSSSTYISSTSTVSMTFAVSLPTPIPLPNTPFALPYTMNTFAGGGLTVGTATMACTGATDKYGNGCKATAVGLNGDLRGITTDPFGNVYFTDGTSSQVRRISPNGVISNFAGYVSGTACTPTATVGCTPTLVSLSSPRGVNSDSAGNIYISGYNQNRVFKVSVTDGLLYLVAGISAGTSGYSGDGGAATSAKISGPRAAWVDSIGNLYISDTGNYRIRMVDTSGNIQTVAGTGTNSDTGDGGPATAATISISQGVLTDANMNLYIADTNRIRVVCVTCGTGSPLDTLLTKLGITPVNGYIYTIAGGASVAYTGTYPTQATNIILSPQKMAFDNNSNIYIADGGSGANAPYSAVWMLDLNTGNIRPVAGTVSSNCSGQTDSYGDGCQATQAILGNSGNGIGVATDPLGNIYVTDAKNARIRKVSNNLQASATTTGATLALPVQLHFVPGDTLATSNGIFYTFSEWSMTTPTCTPNADTSTDCLLTSSFIPALPGLRSTPLVVSSLLGTKAYLGLTGTGTGAGATLDPASQSKFGTGLTVAGLATDNAGNVYVSDTASKHLLRYSASSLSKGTSASATTLATLTAPGAVAVDQRGYVYVADTSAGTITQVSPAGTATVMSFTFTAPAGLAIDAQNNLYVSDSTAAVVYQINPITGAKRTLSVGTLVTPEGLAIDPSGNLLIADPGVPALYRYNFATKVLSTVSSTATAPEAVVSDAAGNLLVADVAQILAVPASSKSAAFTLASIAPASLAIDAAGNLYTGAGGGVLKLTRTQGYYQFSGPGAAAQTIAVMNSGNLSGSITSVAQTDSADYTLTPTASTDCVLGSGNSATLASGGVCAISSSYTPTTYLATTNTVTLNGNLMNAALSTPSTPQFVLTGPATTPTVSVIAGVAPSSPVFGQSVSITASVTGAGSAMLLPLGTVTFTVDGSSTPISAVQGSNGNWSATLTILTTAQHTVVANYVSSNGYAAASSSALTFTVGQGTPTITWATPAAITYGTTLSATQLNATANVAGSFSYSPASGALLTAGPQMLSVTFTPTDKTDYATVTGNVTLTVNQITPTITWATPTAITYGTTLSATQLNATANVAGTFSYTPASGALQTAGSQKLSVTFTPTDATDYTTATGSVTLTVNQATPAITWATPTAITYGTMLSSTQLNATANVAGSFSYTPASGALLTAGSQKLSVTFTPTDATDYTTATDSVTLTVNKVSPTITWATPAAITSVTPLSSVQLNATASVAGSFSYTPAAGTLLAVGAQRLTVNFTPTDVTDYSTAIGSVTLTVNSATPMVMLTSSVNPVLLQNPVVFTATATANVGTPTGTVNFLDGTTLLGSVAVTSGSASFSSSSLALGSHSITAAYSGDANFIALTSSALTQTVFTIDVGTPSSGTSGNGSGSGATQTVTPGGTASYSLPISPSTGNSFPVDLKLTVSGLPAGATASITPSAWVVTSSNTWKLAANTALIGNTQLTIELPKTTASAQHQRGTGDKRISSLAPLALGLLMLPFVGRMRRASKRLRSLSVLLLLMAGMLTTLGVTGCTSGGGFFTQAQQSYLVTVTVSSGALQIPINLTLTVE